MQQGLWPQVVGAAIMGSGLNAVAACPVTVYVAATHGSSFLHSRQATSPCTAHKAEEADTTQYSTQYRQCPVEFSLFGPWYPTRVGGSPPNSVT